MSTKLDKWIEQCDGKNTFSTAFRQAINEYKASRQWVEGPPPEGCNAAFVDFGVVEPVVKPAVLQECKWYTDKGWVIKSDIIRHCPIPPHPPLPEPPKPAIPEEVAKHGDGCYRICFDRWPSVIRRIENNHVLKVDEDPTHVHMYVQKWGVISWKYLGDIPRDVAKHGDGWYWRGKEVVKVIGPNYFLCGSNSIRDVTNDGCKWEYIPERKGG